MSTAPPPAPAKTPARPETPPAWKWVMRVTGTLALLLFLTPTFYVVKYYGMDRPNEQKLVEEEAAPRSGLVIRSVRATPDTPVEDLPSFVWVARNDPHPETKKQAIAAVETVLLQPGVGWKRPMECLAAKADLAEVATKDADPSVRRAASEALGKVAQGGAVIRR